MQQNQFESYEQLSENKFLSFESEPHKGKPKRRCFDGELKDVLRGLRNMMILQSDFCDYQY